MKVAIINPVSSGKCLVEALEDSGAQVLKIYEEHLKTGDNYFFVHANLDETVSYLKAQKVSAIINGSEFGTYITDELNTLMNLPGNDISKIKARTNKYDMTEQLLKSGIKCAKSFTIDSHEQILSLQHDLSYPLFIKPVASAGSDGCKKVCNINELSTFFAEIHGKENLLGKRNNSVLVQEFIEGEQFIVNSISLNGDHLITEVYRVKIDQHNGVPVYRSIVTIDMAYESPLYESVTVYIKGCLNALGVVEGAAHSELRMTNTGPCLIEVNSRIMGPVLDADAFYSAFGYSQPSLLSESILQPEKFRQRLKNGNSTPKKHFAMIFMRCTSTGKISNRLGLENLRRLPGYHSIRNLPALGYKAQNPLLTTGDFGIAYFCHEDRALLEQSISVLHQMEDEHLIFGITSDE